CLMLRLSTRDKGFETAFARLVNDRRESDDDVARDVALILHDLKVKGDEALADYTARFDGHRLVSDADWRITPEACRKAFDTLEPALRDALELAAERIRRYHEAQLPSDRDFRDEAGVRLGAKWRPVDAA